MYRKQFLLAEGDREIPGLAPARRIGRYGLYLGPDTRYAHAETAGGHLHLIGSLYDWERPLADNAELLTELAALDSLRALLKATDRYCGEFVLMLERAGELFLFHDAAGQKEIYYDDDFTCFGSQPRLLGLVTELRDHTDPAAVTFYRSDVFDNKRLFVGATTHKQNVHHLLPNHYLDVRRHSIHRFFPTDALSREPIAAVAKRAARLLRGYLAAIANRGRLKLALTGGYDSRILFLASLHVDSEYYVAKRPYINDNHHDVVIPVRLTGYYGKQFSVEEIVDDAGCRAITENMHDLDFPRYLDWENMDADVTYINGNISEVARNYYGYHRGMEAEDLSFLAGNADFDLPVREYRKWLAAKPVFDRLGYHYLDMFYWEEKMGNWAAKAKAEYHARGGNVTSPFNSRLLLRTLLSCDRKFRDSHFNQLYDAIIAELSDHDPVVMNTPINPSRKQTVIRLMKSLKVYNLYRHVGMKTRKLQV